FRADRGRCPRGRVQVRDVRPRRGDVRDDAWSPGEGAPDPDHRDGGAAHPEGHSGAHAGLRGSPGDTVRPGEPPPESSTAPDAGHARRRRASRQASHDGRDRVRRRAVRSCRGNRRGPGRGRALEHVGQDNREAGGRHHRRTQRTCGQTGLRRFLFMVFVGTAGWQYPHWRRLFYPEHVPQHTWLEYYSRRFQTVEVNNTFYSLPEAEVFAEWKRQTPPDFVFALKMSRFLTHLKRLRDPEDPVR